MLARSSIDHARQTARREWLRACLAAGISAIGARRLAAAEPELVAPIRARLTQWATDAALAMQFRGTTAHQCQLWQQEFARELRRMLGPIAPPTTWNTHSERVVDCGDHRRHELVLIAPGQAPLPVHLLVPHAGGRSGARAGIVAIHGHGDFGHDSVAGIDTSAERREAIARANYDYGRQLVRQGYVVAAPCLTPFGRRLTPEYGRGGTANACDLAFIRLQQLGRVLIGENIRDARWALELLAGRDDVDPTRLACVGLSYGGRVTTFAAALEPRFRAAVISGAMNCLQERMITGNAAGCQTIPGLLPLGDVPEVCSLIAPRPLAFEVGARDKLLDPAWVTIAEERIRRAYRAYDAEQHLHIDRFDGGHQWHGTVAEPVLAAALQTR